MLLRLSMSGAHLSLSLSLSLSDIMLPLLPLCVVVAQVRSLTDGEKLIDAIAEIGYNGSFNKPELEIEQAAPSVRRYLDDEEDENSAENNKYGIITQEQAASMAKADEGAGWFGWGSRISRALWG
jgi:hypothetical protein